MNRRSRVLLGLLLAGLLPGDPSEAASSLILASPQRMPSKAAPSAQQNIPPPVQSPLPSDLFAALQQALRFRNRGELEQSRAALEALMRVQPTFVPVLIEWIDLLESGGMTQEAVQAFRAKTQREPSLAEHWYGLGRSLLAVQDAAGALTALEAADRLGCRDWHCVSDHVRAAEATGHLETLEPRFTQRLASSDPVEQGLAQLGLALIWQATDSGVGNSDKSPRYLEALRAASELLPPGGGKEAALSLRGYYLVSSGLMREAQDCYRAAIPLYRAMNDAENEARALDALGYTLSREGDSLERIPLFNRQLTLYRSLEDKPREVETLILQGSKRQELGELTPALEILDQAHTLSQRLPETQRTSKVLVARGLILSQMGRNEEALILLEQAVTLSLEREEKSAQAYALDGLAKVQLERGQVGVALSAYAQALDLYRAGGDVFGEGVVLQNWGDALWQLGDRERGEALLEQALPLHRVSGNWSAEAATLANLGDAYKARGEQIKAQTAYRDALKIHRDHHDIRSAASDQTRLAQLALEQGELEAAHSQAALAVTQLRTVGDPVLLGLGLVVLGNVQHARGQIEASIQHLIEARKCFHEQGLSWYEGHALTALGRVYAAQKERTLALNALQDALSLHAHLRGAIGDPALESRYFAHNSGLYPLAVQLRLEEAGDVSQISHDHFDATFQLAEEARSTSYQRWLYGVHRQPVSRTSVSVEELQKSLDPDTVILSFLLGKERSFVWVVTHNSRHLALLPPESDITPRVREVVRMISSDQSPLPVLIQRSSTLFQTLLGPVAPFLPPEGRLILLPDGSLSALPFEVLVQRSAKKPGAPPAYLGRQYAISYAGSLRGTLEQTALLANPLPSGPLLALGDPTYDRDLCGRSGTALLSASAPGAGLESTYNRLCWSRQEVASIRRSRLSWFFPQKDRYLLGDQASEAELRTLSLKGYSHLHFATHGVSFPDLPLRSGLVLARPPGGTFALAPESERNAGENRRLPAQDGFLNLNEITNLTLNADLVVLSACQTAEGRHRQGEGIESLARAFLLAGSRQVIGSHWRIHDAGTAQFMRHFYGALKRQSVAAALQTARNAALASAHHSHPYYWAAFVLMH